TAHDTEAPIKRSTYLVRAGEQRGEGQTDVEREDGGRAGVGEADVVADERIRLHVPRDGYLIAARERDYLGDLAAYHESAVGVRQVDHEDLRAIRNGRGSLGRSGLRKRSNQACRKRQQHSRECLHCSSWGQGYTADRPQFSVNLLPDSPASP